MPPYKGEMDMRRSLLIAVLLLALLAGCATDTYQDNGTSANVSVEKSAEDIVSTPLPTYSYAELKSVMDVINDYFISRQGTDDVLLHVMTGVGTKDGHVVVYFEEVTDELIALFKQEVTDSDAVIFKQGERYELLS